MVDVDHFKRINDRFGHLVGDIVLREISGIIRESTRAEDLVARYGGEEFIVALPVSSPDLATERAERIRTSVAARRIRAGGSEIRVTVSIGLAFGAPHWPLSEISLDPGGRRGPLPGQGRRPQLRHPGTTPAHGRVQGNPVGRVPHLPLNPAGPLPRPSPTSKQPLNTLMSIR